MNQQLLKSVESNLESEGHKIIFTGIHGSHLYGLSTPDSDMDFKGVYIPSLKSILCGQVKDQITVSTGSDASKNSAEDVDVEFYSIHKFMKMLVKGETIAIDMLHTNLENTLISSPQWSLIQNSRKNFYCKDMKAFLGYVKKQAHKYGVRGSRLEVVEKVYNKVLTLDRTSTVKPRISTYESLTNFLEELSQTNKYVSFNTEGLTSKTTVLVEVAGAKFHANTPLSIFQGSLEGQMRSYGERARLAKDNKGIDWKAMSHAIRCAHQLKEIYLTGDLKYPLKERELLLDIKKGNKDFLTEVSPMLDELVDEVGRLSLESSYPSQVDNSFADQLLIDLLKVTFNRSLQEPL